jgi:hypothetical protein
MERPQVMMNRKLGKPATITSISSRRRSFSQVLQGQSL